MADTRQLTASCFSLPLKLDNKAKVDARAGGEWTREGKSRHWFTNSTLIQIRRLTASFWILFLTAFALIFIWALTYGPRF